jgi:hypothetical protein
MPGHAWGHGPISEALGSVAAIALGNSRQRRHRDPLRVPQHIIEEEAMRRIILAALISTIGLSTAAAGDPFTGDLTEGQLHAINVVTIANLAGTDDACPRFHVMKNALFAELIEGKVSPAIMDTREFKNAVAFKIADVLLIKKDNVSDWCLAVWQLFGPGGLYRRQLVETN